jgi:hypothetical protein
MKKILSVVFGLLLILSSITVASDSSSPLKAKIQFFSAFAKYNMQAPSSKLMSGQSVLSETLDNKMVSPIFNSTNQTHTVSSSKRLNTVTALGNSYEPDIAISGNNVYVIWFQNIPMQLGTKNGDIFFTKSRDNGGTFGNIVDLGKGAKPFEPPRVLVSGNAVYIMWISSDNKIYFRKSTDNGATFDNAVIIGNTGKARPQLAASGNNVYIMWADATLSHTLFFRKSTDNGATFENPIVFSNDLQVGSQDDEPASYLSSDGNKLYVSWIETSGRINFRKSADNGYTFGTPIDLKNPGRFPFASHLQVAYAGNNVYVAWSNNGMLFTKSTDGGATFAIPVHLRIPGSLSIAASGNNVYIASLAGETSVLLRRSTDGGATFGEPVGITNPVCCPALHALQLTTSANNIYLTWLAGGIPVFTKSTDGGATFGSTARLGEVYNSPHQIEASGNQIYLVMEEDNRTRMGEKVNILFTKSTDGGATFGTAINLSNNFGTISSPQIAVSGGNVYIVSKDFMYRGDIFSFRRSIDGGATFGSVIKINNNLGVSSPPQIAAAGKNVYILWTDGSSRKDSIYFRRSIDSGATFENAINLTNNNNIKIKSIPKIALSGEDIYVAFIGENIKTPFSHEEIFFIKSTNNGATFDSPVRLTLSEGFIFALEQLVASGNKVYILSNEFGKPDTSGTSRPTQFLRISTDFGATFGSRVQLIPAVDRISSSVGGSFGSYSFVPQLAVSGNNVYFLWPNSAVNRTTFERHGNIILNESVNNGTTFERNLVLANTSHIDYFDPQIVESDNDIYTLWLDSNGTIFFTKSTDKGATFATAIGMGKLSHYIAPPLLSAIGSNVYAVSSDLVDEKGIISFRKSTDKGSTFGTSIQINNGLGFSLSPQLAISGSNVYLTWIAGGNQILFTRSTDNGATFDRIVVFHV